MPNQNKTRIAVALAALAAFVLLLALAIYELMSAGGSGNPKSIVLAPAPPAAPPQKQPDNGLNQLTIPWQDIVQQQVQAQMQPGSPLYKAMSWNLSAHQPGENLSDRWKRSLDHGVTVEMIAVGHPDEDITHWWDGDGKPLLMLPQWGDRVGARGYVLRVSYPTPAGKDAALLERTIGDSSSIFPIDGTGNAEIFFTADAPAKGQPLHAEIGVGVGAWKKADTLNRLVPETIAGNPGQSTLDFSYVPSADEEQAWAAIDKSGKTHWISSEGPISARPAAAKRLSEKDYLLLAADRVDHIAVFTRPRVWVTFTDMPDAPETMQPTTRPTIVFRPGPPAPPASPSTQPTASPAPPGMNALLSAFANGNVTVVVHDVHIGPGLDDVETESQLRLAESRLRQSASDAFGEIDARKALRGICDPPPDLLLLTGKRADPGKGPPDAAITALRLDGQVWKYDSFAETSADRLARRAAVLDSAADDVEAGNYADAPALRTALLRKLSRIDSSPATQPAEK